MIETPDNLIRPAVQLTGEDGNAFAIIGKMRRELRRAGNSPEAVKRFTQEAQSSDYDHVLATCMAYAEVS